MFRGVQKDYDEHMKRRPRIVAERRASLLIRRLMPSTSSAAPVT